MCGGEEQEIKGNALPEGPEVEFVGHSNSVGHASNKRRARDGVSRVGPTAPAATIGR